MFKNAKLFLGCYIVLEAFKAFEAKVELQQGKKIKVVHSVKGYEYYGRYDETGRNPRPFAKDL